MENENKWLELARKAKAEKNPEDALKYYAIVHEQDPENVEAKFCYAYFKMTGGLERDFYKHFITFCNVIKPTIDLLLAGEYTDEEKKGLFDVMLGCLQTSFNTALKIEDKKIFDTDKNDTTIIFKLYYETLQVVYTKILELYSDDLKMALIAYETKLSYVKYYAYRYDSDRRNAMKEMIEEVKAKYGEDPDFIKFANKITLDLIDEQYRDIKTGDKGRLEFIEKLESEYSSNPEVLEYADSKWHGIIHQQAIHVRVSNDIKTKAIDLYTLGDKIESRYAHKNEYRLLKYRMQEAVECWKDGVAHQQEFYAYVTDKSMPKRYADKIKKYEPTYEMPQKAGCLSVKNK